MTAPEPKYGVVWILGAGFSQPLGGPMLRDLLSLESRADLLDAHKLTEQDPGVYWLYHYGRRFEDGWLGDARPKGERLWEDAEDFLDKLDAAVSGERSPLRPRFEAILADARMPDWAQQDRLSHVRDSACRYIAAECCLFLTKTPPTGEQWEPYISWACDLESNDVVISFNYDRVVESIEPRGRIVTVTREEHWSDESEHPRLLKLHGSVDWEWNESDRTIAVRAPDFAAKCPAKQLLIATPGPNKKNIAGGPLAFLWEYAEEALKNCGAVVFMGYRFPPTDAQARSRILNAIRSNENPILSFHVVLGPREDPDVVRLTQMLRYVAKQAGRTDRPMTLDARSFRLQWHPLWSQDFMTLARRADLVVRRR